MQTGKTSSSGLLLFHDQTIFADMVPGYLKAVMTAALFVLLTTAAASQDPCGLELVGQREPIDKRSGLDLSPGDFFYINSQFTLSFDLSFLPEKPDYFGYVLRIIADNQNIDLLYRPRTDAGEFYIIYGKGETEILVESDRRTLFDQWNHVEFTFDPKTDNLSFKFNGREVKIDSLGVRDTRKYKFLFGMNTFGDFATTDLPPMKIRDIRININQKEKYYWPLDETGGNMAKDINHGKEGFVINPVWLKPLHTTWSLRFEEEIAEGVQAAFNAEENVVYLVSQEYITEFNLLSGETQKIYYSDGDYLMVTGAQVVYDTLSNNLYSYSIDRQQLFRFDFINNKWEDNYTSPQPLTIYWHHNKFLSFSDTSIYIFNGYGQLSYRNDIFRVSLSKGVWQRTAFKGDTITPRYLAGLGYSRGLDSLYIIGGYGSTSGDQLINPHGYSDLYLVDMARREITRKLEYSVKGEDEFCFAGNVIMDDKNHLLYGLIYAKNKPNDRLQMIETSMTSDYYRHVGYPIPYRFYDIVSSADLFYSENLETMVAVTRQQVDKLINVSVYTLKFPPAPVELTTAKNSFLKYLISAVLIIVLVIAFSRFLYSARRKKRRDGNTKTENSMIMADRGMRILNQHEEKHQNAILLFGGFQVFNRDGVDVTRSFTPILTRLFLSILLNSFGEGKGLTSGMLRDLIWFGKPEQNARNTMAVNMIRLRRILEAFDGLQINNETRYLRFDFNPELLYVDYYEYLVITETGHEASREEVNRLLRLFHQGSLLKDITFEGSDSFKAEVSDKMRDFLWRFVKTLDTGADADLVIEVCNTIFIFDELDEEAIVLKCQTLLKSGKHSLAVQCFDKFSRQYSELYGEGFGKSYKDVFGADPV